MDNANHSCRLCQAGPDSQSIKNAVVYGGTRGQHFWICAECDAIYLYPAPSDAEDTLFYENDFNKWMVERSGDDKWTHPDNNYAKLRNREMPLRGPWLDKIAKGGQKVLEIGSSTGFTLAYLKDKDCDCTGVELNLEYAEYAKKLGLNIYTKWENLTKNIGYFDLILHYYVLEHVSDPLAFLKECQRYLAPNGKMVFEIPCGNDPLTSLYEIPAFNDFYWMRAHHWYFTPKSLGYVLNKLGRPYEIHPGQRYDLSNHMHWMMTGKPGGLGKYNHIFSPETLRSYSEDLKKSGHYDYMIAIVS